MSQYLHICSQLDTIWDVSRKLIRNTRGLPASQRDIRNQPCSGDLQGVTFLARCLRSFTLFSTRGCLTLVSSPAVSTQDFCGDIIANIAVYSMLFMLLARLALQ